MEAALEEVYTKITEQFKGNLHTHFEVVALSSHDPKIRQIIFEDYQKDIEAVEAFVEEKKKQGDIRTDVDARVLAELFTALYLGTLAKLVIGFPNKEVHDQLDQIHDSDSWKNKNLKSRCAAALTETISETFAIGYVGDFLWLNLNKSKLNLIVPESHPMHEEPVSTVEPSRLACEICGKAFKTHTELDRHMENAHGNPEKTHTGTHTGHRVE